MIKVALIGAGKMGISHLSILGAHPMVQIVGVADTSKIVNDVLEKYSGMKTFTDYKKMLDEVKPDAVFVSVPTKFHASFVEELLNRNIHVFVEKPFCLNATQGENLIRLAKRKGLVNQVGYHNKFVGTFEEVKRLVSSGALGELNHFIGEAYGPVVIRKKQDTWRSDPEEGGGCLMDYASHVIDLINYLVAPITKVHGSLLKSIYSTQVEDAVYSLLETSNQVSGVLSVNWSDETHRKMSTGITIIGSKGKIISDASELKVFLKSDDVPEGYSKGWNIKYITELTPGVDFYLRGEEYSAQIDYFINAVDGKGPNEKNSFESAWNTDYAISLIKTKKIKNMDRILFGDNQFFAVNHISDEKSRAQSIKFKEDKTILDTIDISRNLGVETFMCTTHDRIYNICDMVRAEPDKYSKFSIYPCMPYAHKYANAVTELGIMGTIKHYVPGNFFGSIFKGGMAFVSKDYISIMELLIDAEMKMFKNINTPVIFLQNVITDLLLGLDMKDILKAYHDYVIKKYNAEPGYITMNMPMLLEKLESVGIKNPIICSSINKAGFRMSGGMELYENVLRTRQVRAIAMQVLGGGAIPAKEAIEYVCSLPNVESILFGASSRQNISQTISLINEFDEKFAKSK